MASTPPPDYFLTDTPAPALPASPVQGGAFPTMEPVFLMSGIQGMAAQLRLINPVQELVDLWNGAVKAPENLIQNLQKYKIQTLITEPSVLVKYLPHLRDLKWVHSTWAGVDAILKIVPKPPFVLTRHAAPKLGRQMAEYVVSHIIANERAGLLETEDGETRDCRTLDELSVAVLGGGEMGMAVSKMLQALGCKIHLLTRTSYPIDQNFTTITNKLKDAVQTADYIVNVLPSTPHTRNVLTTELLQECSMPHFINAGRADVIDSNVLIHALGNKLLSGATLDVEPEPVNGRSPFHKIPGITRTHHTASITDAKSAAPVFFMLYNMHYSGEDLPRKFVVDLKTGY